MKTAIAAVVGTACLVWTSIAAAECRMEVAADIPVTMEGAEPLVESAINGTPVKFLLDTGSVDTMITRGGAAKLGLKTRAVSRQLTYYGIDGAEVPQETSVQEWKLGQNIIRNQSLVVAGAMSAKAPYQGILGETILGQADLEIDLKGGHVRLIRPVDCAGDKVVYWGGSYSVADLEPDENDAIHVWLQLNGHRTLAELDTGASSTVVATDAAERAGAKLEESADPNSRYAYGIAGRQMRALEATFKSLSVGDETIRNTRLEVADIFKGNVKAHTGSRIDTEIDGQPEMLLGAEFIKAHRIYIARKQNKMYFSYAGGSIFGRPPASKVADAPAAAKTPGP